MPVKQSFPLSPPPPPMQTVNHIFFFSENCRFFCVTRYLLKLNDDKKNVIYSILFHVKSHRYHHNNINRLLQFLKSYSLPAILRTHSIISLTTYTYINRITRIYLCSLSLQNAYLKSKVTWSDITAGTCALHQIIQAITHYYNIPNFNLFLEPNQLF